MSPRPAPRVIDAAFVLSAPTARDLPAADRPELALAGRSNAGKSSLLGALLGRPGLVRTSRTPGCTVLLNLFEARLRRGDAPGRSLRLVDLPGYGFAARGAAERAALARRIDDYLRGRRPVSILLLLDVRRGWTQADRDFAARAGAAGHPLVLVATKADKLGRAERGLRRRRIAEAVGVGAKDVWLTSARTGEGIGGADGLVGLLWDLAGDAAPDVAEGTVEVEAP